MALCLQLGFWAFFSHFRRFCWPIHLFGCLFAIWLFFALASGGQSLAAAHGLSLCRLYCPAFLFHKLLLVSKILLRLKKKSHSTQSLKRESSGKLFIGQWTSFLSLAAAHGLSLCRLYYPASLFTNFFLVPKCLLDLRKNQILPKFWKEKVQIYFL